MTGRVTSSVYGGSYGVADDGAYRAAWARLEAARSTLTACADAWTRTAFALSARQMDVLARLPAVEAAGGAAAASAALTHRITRAVDACNDIGTMLRRIGDECGRLADLVARAHGLYNAAESGSRRLTSKAVQLLTTLNPAAMAALAAGVGLYGASVGRAVDGSCGAADGSSGIAHASHATAWMQEGLMAGIGAHLSGIAALGAPGGLAGPGGLSALGSLGDDGRHVAAAAGGIAAVSAPANDRLQGDRLVVACVSPLPDARPVGYVDSTAAALHDLRRLGAANGDGARTGLSYATIAISRYAREDGTNAWLVTIPGTDGQPDSPFGWEQNVELMGDDAVRRARADSARFVAEAMRLAGVGADDPVALVGHSQGGIVAATLASDYVDEFRIEHIVTAGSPIANHPVGDDVWVTSVEMEDELVAALDGAANPQSDRWLTVRGALAADGDDGRLLASSPVDIGDGPLPLTHDLAFHEAAYANAVQLGSPALERHDMHLRATIGGGYQGTTYWQGRIGDDTDDGRHR